MIWRPLRCNMSAKAFTLIEQSGRESTYLGLWPGGRVPVSEGGTSSGSHAAAGQHNYTLSMITAHTYIDRVKNFRTTCNFIMLKSCFLAKPGRQHNSSIRVAKIYGTYRVLFKVCCQTQFDNHEAKRIIQLSSFLIAGTDKYIQFCVLVVKEGHNCIFSLSKCWVFTIY